MKTTLSLPMPAEMLVPHRPPILVIERLLEFNDTKGVVESCMHPDSIFARKDGSIEQVTMVEIIAQSFAAVKGYADLLEGKPISKGFLVGVKRLNIFGMAFIPSFTRELLVKITASSMAYSLKRVLKFRAKAISNNVISCC